MVVAVAIAFAISVADEPGTRPLSALVYALGAVTLADVGSVAAFVASAHARTLTATEVNISCGALMD